MDATSCPMSAERSRCRRRWCCRGYPERERTVSADIRAEVFQRAGGLCESCGRTLDFDGTSGNPDLVPTIQHVEGNSNDLDNLKAFCNGCNMADAEAKFVPVEPGSPQAVLAAHLAERCASPIPMKLCDDDESWNDIWRGLASSARDVIRQRESAGSPC